LDETHTSGVLHHDPGAKRPGLIAFVWFAAWSGLIAGLLEVGTTVVRKQTVDPNQLYKMSRHFVWLIPVTNVCVFLVIGMLLWAVGWVWPGRIRWLGSRLMCALALLPTYLVAFPRVYAWAFCILSAGTAASLVPFLERHARGFRRFVRVSFPMLLLILVALAASPWVADRRDQAREDDRSLPPPGSPNVLLMVLDTVAAGHLSLYGYARATSPTLVELAERGIRFDSAQAASSWTLPSHATMFTGRWLHELSVGWLSPLDDSRPTLAEYLGSRGYATGGFVGNAQYCGRDTGLGRGFTQYRDYIFPNLSAFRMAVLVSRTLDGIQAAVPFVDQQQDFVNVRRCLAGPLRLFNGNRKRAAAVNREFVDWLSHRPRPERPFFAFLNYVDAHAPYEPPKGRLRRFGSAPIDDRQSALIANWSGMPIDQFTPPQIRFAADAYDDCIANLDEQIGKLVDELRRREVLDRTWLIIVADHGESFGEHTGVFGHGTSLYQTELHVPLLFVPPGGLPAKRVVSETVSLRDLAATIVGVLGFESGSPFPGASLAHFWDDNLAKTAATRAPSELALAEVLPNDPLDLDAYGLPNRTWPLAALNTGEWSYIRREHDASEELFHVRDDAREERNLAADPAARTTLEQIRDALRVRTNGPLVPERFNR
jgi:arylsulfatase A-like enzyme